mgnify:FL=1
MNSYYLTDPGKVRTHNEDSVVVMTNENGEKLMIVADGMGGHRSGEIASSIVVSHVGKSFTDKKQLGTKEEAKEWMKNVISESNVLIYKYTIDNPDSMGMGTTIVMSLITNDYLLFGNIGDSSGYVLKNNHLHKITVDHTLVNLLVKSGELTEEEAREHPRRNVLMRALGTNMSVEMDIFDVETDVDGVLLCSDGLTNMLKDDQIIKILIEDIPVENKVKKLIVKCNNRGGTDNISIAYLEKKEG